jgi:hypothetical protein
MTLAVNIAQSGSSNVTFRNKIINGAMVFDQRNAGASVTPTNDQYLLDRWIYFSTQTSKVTCQQNQGSVTPPAGFTNYFGFTSSSAYSLAAGDYFATAQSIEGYNVADLAWGTANAKPITLSFWVRSSLTGTFGGVLNNAGNSRSYPFTYTISSANTWTQISVTIAGDTSGTWNTTNGIGLRVLFSLGVGTTYSGTAGAWAGTVYLSATGATSVVGTSGATFYITGVQLEAGTTASPFEYRQYGTELVLCQRYYCKSYQIETAVGTSTTTGCYGVIASGSTALIGGGNKWPVQMRATPTVTIYSQTGTSGKLTVSGGSDIGTGVVSETPSQFGAVGIFASGGFTGATWYYGHFAATAEL